ncbi:alpha/beta fold hydrolase [Streptacidiphilus sp. PB12-B1b]|uniref:alpha/beta fold hydrolase n=1 Tax=Streptacidiphilus sp. PB12-B1b TaxID=2705012 RepID=UPI0015FCE622|nr:alpha/beta fold hydrolase [Streptacidiphilus sp. PB12-B1b]QMU79136.1 alpha/beta fold hydrolase [Streptacidiphilus sp. PB12-B1b]
MTTEPLPPLSALAVRESGSGTPLVLLHAFPLSSRMWQAQLDDLPGRDGSGARVLAVDLRGFGGTDLGPDRPSLDLLADDLALLLDRAGIDRAVVGGLSLGGYTAMALARRHPHRLAGLLLADTKAAADTEQQRANRERIAAAVLARDSVRLLVDEQLPSPLLGAGAAERDPGLVERVRAMIEEAAPASVAWMQRAMAARPDSLAALARLEVPAAVVVGELDAITPPADAEAMAAALPDAVLTVIPQAGHLSALEAPDAFNAAVRALLRRVG